MTTTDDAFTGSPDQSERRCLIATNTWHHGITKLISRDGVALVEESDGDTHTYTHSAHVSRPTLIMNSFHPRRR